MVRIAHEKAQELDKAGVTGLREEIDLTARLRPVTMDDFWAAPKCQIPVIINIREVRWCHLEGTNHAEHETIHDRRTVRWRDDERSITT